MQGRALVMGSGASKNGVKGAFDKVPRVIKDHTVTSDGVLS